MKLKAGLRRAWFCFTAAWIAFFLFAGPILGFLLILDLRSGLGPDLTQTQIAWFFVTGWLAVTFGTPAALYALIGAGLWIGEGFTDRPIA